VSGEPRVETFRGDVPAGELGFTLLHEHLFVGHQELDLNFPHPEWDEAAAVERAVAVLTRLHGHGVRTLVDLSVPGLGRDGARVALVAARVPLHVVAATGWYTADVLPAFFHSHGPGSPVGGPDPLVAYLRRDVVDGIAGTGVRAAVLKVVTDRQGVTPDVGRVLAAAARVHRETGVPIVTHTHAPSRSGREQLAVLRRHGVAARRVVGGHCGDSEDLDYLRELLASGATLGMDRFGMEHVLPDERRVAVVLRLLREGYADRLVLSQDAAVFSRVTPPSWRARHAPNWHLENLSRRILPMLADGGATDDELHRMTVTNPARLLTPRVTPPP
jgi:phosphotriesterase-related protein